LFVYDCFVVVGLTRAEFDHAMSSTTKNWMVDVGFYYSTPDSRCAFSPQK